MRHRLKAGLGAFLALAITTAQAFAQTPRQPSTCLAIAQNLNQPPELPVRYASLAPQNVALESSQVAISFQGHSTYLIETASGVTIATDFAGWLTDPVTPRVVTMNQAHSSHYTNFPDPAIEHVLRGWREAGVPAEHHLVVEDVLIRNVTTDILRFGNAPDGNSIFIFEVAGLCIGHLGHLHHRLGEERLARIGRLDVVMVPVDGGLTLTHTSLRELLDRLRSSVILPMHVRFANALPRFLAHLGPEYPVVQKKERKLVLSLRDLPKRPTVILLPGVSSAPGYIE